MARRNKKTRIKGIPPRIQLQTKDARTGSYPSKVRTSSDNRTGKYPISWNDTNTINFGAITHQENLFNNGPLVKDELLGYWKFNSGSYVSQAPGDYIVDYGPVPNGDGYLGTQQGGVGKNYTDTQIIMYVTGNTGQAVELVTDDLPFSLKTGERSAFGDIGGALKFQHNVSANSDLWSVASVYSGTLFAPIEGGGGGEQSWGVSAWVKITASAYPASGMTVACKAALNRTDIDWSLDIDNNGLLVLSLYNDLSNKIESSSSFPVALNEWTMVRASCLNTFDSADIILQRGSEPKESEDNIGDVGTYTGQTYNSNPVVIGASDLATPNFPGYICEVAFYRQSIQHELQPSSDGIALPNVQDSLVAPINGVVAGIGLNKNSKWIEDSEQVTTLILTSGSVRKGIGDTQVHFTPGQDLTPFKDNDNPAVDGKSSGNPFYVTGSNPSIFGSDLQQPLWSKTKIEIPINIPTEHSISIRVDSSDATRESHSMAYHNFDTGIFEGIGRGRPETSFASIREALDDEMMGFAPSLLPLDEPYRSAGAGYVTNAFGFPAHAKYHATSSQLINLSDYIDEPFLIEKFSIELSTSFHIGSGIRYYAAGYCSASINTLFVGIQRTAFLSKSFDMFNSLGPGTLGSFPGDAGTFEPLYFVSPTRITGSGDTVFDVRTIRDLVGWSQVTSYASGARDFIPTGGSWEYASNITIGDLMDREINIEHGSDTSVSGVNWSQSVKHEFEAATPVTSENVFSSYISRTDLRAAMSQFQGGSNGLGLFAPSGRNRRSPFLAAEDRFSDVWITLAPDFDITPFKLGVPATRKKINPFLVKPGDSLFLGWQLPFVESPFFDTVTDRTFCHVVFAPGQYKLTIYGSRLSEDREVHDTLNQLLTSDAIHEVIG